MNQAYKGELVEIDKSFYVDKGVKVVKTSDVHQLSQLAASYEQEIKKIPVEMSFTMQEVPTLKVHDGIFEVCVESSLPSEVALKVPLSPERIQQQLSKTNLPYHQHYYHKYYKNYNHNLMYTFFILLFLLFMKQSVDSFHQT